MRRSSCTAWMTSGMPAKSRIHETICRGENGSTVHIGKLMITSASMHSHAKKRWKPWLLGFSSERRENQASSALPAMKRRMEAKDTIVPAPKAERRREAPHCVRRRGRSGLQHAAATAVDRAGRVDGGVGVARHQHVDGAVQRGGGAGQRFALRGDQAAGQGQAM